jgi:hypothetical protein
MNVEIPVGLLIVMTIVNLMLLIVVVTGFINPRIVSRELKNRVQKSDENKITTEKYFIQATEV